MNDEQLNEVCELICDMIIFMFPNEGNDFVETKYVKGKMMVTFLAKVQNKKIAAQLIGKNGSIIMPIREYIKNVGKFNKMVFNLEVVVAENT